MVLPKRSDKREGTRAPVAMFRTERQANFRKNVRKSVLETGKQAKDAERRRMEEYRKLCKREGIQSKRLEEYDQHRDQANETMEKRLSDIDRDQSLSAAEKRKRRFSLKQKMASTTVTEIAAKAQRNPSGLTKLEKIQAARAAEREEFAAKKASDAQDKQQRIHERRHIQGLHQMRSYRGQPVMSGKMEALMAKIQRSNQS